MDVIGLLGKILLLKPSVVNPKSTFGRINLFL
jgi:hypothetical protein